MAFTPFFYHGSTRKIIVAFGTLFNSIKVQRSDDKIITVPLVYSSKENFYLVLKQNYNLDKLVSFVLPRMGFIITDMSYDFERKLASIGKFQSVGVDSSSMQMMYMPVPYNFNIQLSIYARNMVDGLQVLEQIVPFFKPSFNITIVELSEMNLLRDIPITLDRITHDDNTEMTLGDSVRLLRWDLDFTLKANFYGPKSTQSIIKNVYIDYHIDKNGQYLPEIDERYQVKVDPEDANFVDAWTYEELILDESLGDSILPPSQSAVLDKYDGCVIFGDTATYK